MKYSSKVNGHSNKRYFPVIYMVSDSQNTPEDYFKFRHKLNGGKTKQLTILSCKNAYS